MGIHSIILAWKIPGTEEPGGPQSISSQSVRHDLVTKQQQQPHIVTIFLCVVRTLKIYSFSKFHVCNIVLLTIITMMCIRFQELSFYK